MFNILHRPGWALPLSDVTSEKAFFNRREFLRQFGLGTAAAAIGAGCSPFASGADGDAAAGRGKYPASRSKEFDPDWRLTDPKVAATYNNFFEFSTAKDRVHRMTGKFIITPWPLEVSGLVEKPLTLDVSEWVDMMPLEERVYRFRCVEAWAMIVPWTGFPLSKLLEKAVPKPEAKFVRFVTFNRPEQAPGMQDTSYPWPYTEGLTLEEAMHPLTLVATGIYGKPLPKQHGAPVRMVVPWKYGYKSIKSIEKIELVAEQPATLWETMAPQEYPFESNVNPNVRHPRWSQATERMIDTGDRARTKIFNGYGEYVAQMYPKEPGV